MRRRVTVTQTLTIHEDGKLLLWTTVQDDGESRYHNGRGVVPQRACYVTQWACYSASIGVLRYQNGCGNSGRVIVPQWACYDTTKWRITVPRLACHGNLVGALSYFSGRDTVSMGVSRA